MYVLNIVISSYKYTYISFFFVKSGYYPVLRSSCCPGYGDDGTDKCLPQCHLGCPSNSHCAAPNICECDLGYATDEIQYLYEKEVVKSCKISAISIAVISIIGVCTVALIIVILVLIFQRKKEFTKVTQTII